MLQRIFGAGAQSSLIESSFDDISSMLRQSEKMLQLALAALLENQRLEADLEKMDDAVDEGERMVRRSVLEHLAFNPQQDLLPSLVLVSMVQDAERIGDFARGLAELVPLARSPRGGPFAERLGALARRVQPMFELCEEAFRHGDAEKGRRVMNEHAELKSGFSELTRDIAASDLSADMAVVYAGASRILRRISAHLANIASTVVQPFDRIRHGDEEA